VVFAAPDAPLLQQPVTLETLAAAPWIPPHWWRPGCCRRSAPAAAWENRGDTRRSSPAADSCRWCCWQSAVSAALADLESQLGVQLFDRVGKRLVLNEHGRLLYPLQSDAA
jgi:hypothetical protein